MKRAACLFAGSLALLLAVGCNRSSPSPEVVTSTPAQHEHISPHGGTAVVLGREAYHVELVRDAKAGKLIAYVLDGEMEKFIRVKAASFEVVATVAGEKRALTFKAVANGMTGETVGDTSQFEAQADWLKTTSTFAATLVALEIRGATFEQVVFNFPRGND